ncbi:hypothetical protein ABLO27_15370 [Roseibium sp. SCPC15]|uniref:hypothetical protein n=1 Tax=Roseibium sp. SCP15 TaxID=3141376 RepID=UPI00333D6528
MLRLPLLAATVLSLALPASAFADSSYYRYGPHGGYVQGSTHASPGHASRSFGAQGVYGGSATLNGSCTQGAGCSRDWSRTLRNGATASGTITAQRGQGVSRSGTGFRGRTW